MSFFEKIGALGVVAFVMTLLAALYGWIMNIVILVNSSELITTKMFILRIVGIPIAFLGAILGWM